MVAYTAMKLKSVTHGHENANATSGGSTASASVTRLAITKTRTCQPKWLWRVNVFESNAHRLHQIAPPAIVVSTIAPAARARLSGSVSIQVLARTTASTARARPKVG